MDQLAQDTRIDLHHQLLAPISNMITTSSSLHPWSSHQFAATVFSTCIAMILAPSLAAQVRVDAEQSNESQFFEFERIQRPAVNDLGMKAKWAVVRGRLDGNSIGTPALGDGKIPQTEDSPRENCFFAAGSGGGCLAADLGATQDIAEVVTYSWHPSSRAPQRFTLYAATGEHEGFVWDRLDNDRSPEQQGWKRIADVDTRTRRGAGGQHASRVTDESGSLGTYRYWLVEVQPTAANDPFAHTFLCEIDFIAKSVDLPERIVAPERQSFAFSSSDGQYQYVIDVTAAPELADWTETELKPVILEWYPRIVAMLPSEGFTAPTKVTFRYQPSAKMEGIPAYAQGGTISLNAGWMNREKNREARGAVVHEMVHVVQSYQGRRNRGARREPTPGWIVEGIPDYIRWFLYEPQSKGAVLSKEALSKAKHDASYRVSANFIDWVIRTHDPYGTLLTKLNAAAREGRYSNEIWQELTGKSEDELASQWKSQ
ncbi:basic secretory protein [Pirellula sp. SH-Sr6A]|nr:basic secretory protein [Pirellula sp. SH-Sr6A]